MALSEVLQSCASMQCLCSIAQKRKDCQLKGDVHEYYICHECAAFDPEKAIFQLVSACMHNCARARVVALAVYE